MREPRQLEDYVDRLNEKLANVELAVYHEMYRLEQEVKDWQRITILAGLGNVGWLAFFIWRALS